MSYRNSYLLNIKFKTKMGPDSHPLCDLIIAKCNIWLNAIHFIEEDDNSELDRAIKKVFKIFHTIEFELKQFKFMICLDEGEWDNQSIDLIKRNDYQNILSKMTIEYLNQACKVLRDEVISDFNLSQDEKDIEYYVRKLVLYNISDIEQHIIDLSNRIGD